MSGSAPCSRDTCLRPPLTPQGDRWALWRGGGSSVRGGARCSLAGALGVCVFHLAVRLTWILTLAS